MQQAINNNKINYIKKENMYMTEIRVKSPMAVPRAIPSLSNFQRVFSPPPHSPSPMLDHKLQSERSHKSRD
jgi:hypothetical protein